MILWIKSIYRFRKLSLNRPGQELDFPFHRKLHAANFFPHFNNQARLLSRLLNNIRLPVCENLVSLGWATTHDPRLHSADTISIYMSCTCRWHQVWLVLEPTWHAALGRDLAAYFQGLALMGATCQDHDCGVIVSAGSTCQLQDWAAGQTPKPVSSTNRIQAYVLQ